MGDYEGFYEGGYSSLNPDYGNFVGYRLDAGQLSSPTGIQTANQISEVMSRIREGVKNVELQPISQDVFEEIPKQHLKEIRALMQLTGVKPSVHAPMIDPAGFTQQGYGGEIAQKDAERKLLSVIERSKELDPKGNIPIVIHSSGGIPGAEYSPNEEKNGSRFKKEVDYVMNVDTKQIYPVLREKRFLPGQDLEEREYSPDEDIKIMNESEWHQKLANVSFYKKEVDEVLKDAPEKLIDVWNKPITDVETELKSDKEREALNKILSAKPFLDNMRLTFNTLVEKSI